MASSCSLLVAITLNWYCLHSGAAQSDCTRGEMLHTTREGLAECILCRDGTYMEEEIHSYAACKSCTFIEDPDVEVFVRRCNKTHDSVILCKSGFYRRRARNDRQKDRCDECTHCPHPTRACQGYQDTVCCHPNQDAVMTSSGVFVCEERPVVCEPGQFFSTSTEECFPCPAGTFMSAHTHTYKECLKCEQLSENNANHAIITIPCSRTAPTLFGCEDGYFRDPTQESSQKEVSCTPCRSCDRSLVDCGMFHDAVCDDKEETTAAIVPTSGTANDAENSAEGKMPFNGTLGCGERNQCLNATTEPYHHATFDVVTLVACVTLIIILISALCHFPSNTKHEEQFYKRSHRQNLRKILEKLRKTHALRFCTIWAMLFASLFICILLTTGLIVVSNVFYNVFVTMTVIATGVFIIAVINGHTCSRGQRNKSCDEKDDDDSSKFRKAHETANPDTEEQERGELEVDTKYRE
ncbi:unnamed protein product [Candidula unifasciata]|uniref:TNFR-Cys domain-containing protein n=1 Tax=Candidula unifasciata TaxID=100452 RepID=A0A8S3ZV71_9EUPU|nr:unnamed protein product [Candidula unifasciata]